SHLTDTSTDLSFPFTAPPPTAIYTLSLHDALPISIADALPQLVNFGAYPTTIFLGRDGRVRSVHAGFASPAAGAEPAWTLRTRRSEEHTSELQSPYDLVCRLLLEKKKQRNELNYT